MQLSDNNTKAFLALLKAGLWETDIHLSMLGKIDFTKVYNLADEQTVTGVVAAALEHIKDINVPQYNTLLFVKSALMLEQCNISMNAFLSDIYWQLCEKGINPILVKGQGIAQCYERPLWRASGDIDLMLNEDDYQKAKAWFDAHKQVIKIKDENKYLKRVEYKIESWYVELHGTMRGQLGRRIDKMIDKVQKNVCDGGRTRLWMNGEIKMLLPSPDEDVIIVFAHILQHFFRGGIGLRQICDWCRLLWCYRSELDLQLLESRIHAMGVMSEWHTFAALAVDELGMPVDSMPFYSAADRWKRKTGRILSYILKVGNFGHNRDLSYKNRYTLLKGMLISLKLRTGDFINQVRAFPIDAARAYFHLLMNGLEVVLKKGCR